MFTIDENRFSDVAVVLHFILPSSLAQPLHIIWLLFSLPSVAAAAASPLRHRSCLSVASGGGGGVTRYIIKNYVNLIFFLQSYLKT